MTAKGYNQKYKNLFGKVEKRLEREKVKKLTALLPQKIVEQDDYLASMDEVDRQRHLLREYFTKLRRKNERPKKPDPYAKLSWVVTSTPFPQLFHYQPGDEELFKDCNVVRFINFAQARRLYINLLMAELRNARSKRTAGQFTAIRDEKGEA